MHTRFAQVVPKFIQSSYYELFLAELFPQVGVPDSGATDAGSLLVENGIGESARGGGKSGVGGSRNDANSESEWGEWLRQNSLNNFRDDPEALAMRISEAVIGSREVAAAAAAEAAAVVSADEAAAREGSKQAYQKGGKLSERDLDYPGGSADSSAEKRELSQPPDQGKTPAKKDSGSTNGTDVPRFRKDPLDEDFSDEPLVVVGFRKGGFARRVPTSGIARIEEKSGLSCTIT